MATILLVEDDAAVARAISRHCKSRDVDVIHAPTLEDGELLFEEHRDSLDIIVVDGCVNSPHCLDSLDLIRKFRAQGYTNPILAQSTGEGNLSLMQEAGASHACEKMRMAANIFKLLGKQS